MKTWLRDLSIGAGLCAMASVGWTGGAAAETVLKFSTYTPAENFVYKNVYAPMMREIEQKTNGEIKFEEYAGSALGKMPEQYDLAKSGLADIATFIPSYSRGRFPLSEAGTLPFAFATSGQGTMALNDLLETWFDAEYKSVKMLFFWTPVPAGILSKGVEITKLEDLEGLKMRSAGAVTNEMLKLVGANVLTVPLPEVYTALERGVIDATAMDAVTTTSYKLYEPADHFAPLAFTSVVAATAMNKRTWNKLTPEQQKIVMDAAQTAASRIGPLYAEKAKESMEVMRKDNVKIVDFSETERQRFVKVVEPLWDRWVENLEEEGIRAKDFMADFKAAIEAHTEMKQASK